MTIEQEMDKLRALIEEKGLKIYDKALDMNGVPGWLVHAGLQRAEIQELKDAGYRLSPSGPRFTAVWLP
jgi:hypothetical protein